MSAGAIVYETFDEIQIWYVAFYSKRRPRSRLIHWLMHPDMMHCAMFKECGDKTLIIDPKEWGAGVSVVDIPITEAMEIEASACSAMVSIVVDYSIINGYKPRGFYTCVSFIKTVLGLYKCSFVQTPLALYKLLLKYPNATVIKPWSPYMRGKCPKVS